MEAYEKYLETINPYLAKFFEQQKPYIFCKEGCSICCEDGEYPVSYTEMQYLMTGYLRLPNLVKIQIQKQLTELKNQKSEFTKEKSETNKEKFFHECPFLVNKVCSVYNYRPIICRVYGLMWYYDTKKGERRYNMPCCVYKGLNYSSVYDENEGTFTTEKWKQAGFEVEPVSYNISLKFMLDNNLTKFLKLDLKEQKALLDWFD